MASYKFHAHKLHIYWVPKCSQTNFHWRYLQHCTLRTLQRTTPKLPLPSPTYKWKALFNQPNCIRWGKAQDGFAIPVCVAMFFRAQWLKAQINLVETGYIGESGYTIMPTTKKSEVRKLCPFSQKKGTLITSFLLRVSDTKHFNTDFTNHTAVRVKLSSLGMQRSPVH